MSCIKDSAEVKVCADQLLQGDDFAEEFVCKICLVHVVGCGPKLTKCSHLFCGDCLQQWFDAHPGNQTWAQRAKTGGAVPCPVCKTMLNKKSDIYPVEEKGDGNSAFLWQMIQNLKVRCDGRHSGCADGCCSWVGEYGTYAEHLRSGSCGQMLEAEVVPENADFDKSGKHSLEAASTCSQCSYDPSLDELSADDVHNDLGTDSELPPDINDDVGTESESPQDVMESASLAPVAEPAEQDLTSLIQAYVDLEATQRTIVPADLETMHCEAASPCATHAEPDVHAPLPAANPATPTIAALPEPVAQSNKDQPATKNSDGKKKAGKQQKCKTERAKLPAASVVKVNAESMAHQSWAQAAHQWQAYQWQAYQHQAAQYQQYQMACAYRYQMAAHAHASHVQQVQQAVQRQQHMTASAK